MKPRIFVSSTYYDLKYIRDDLYKFICRYGFTPSLFENGGVIFDHGKELDASCYKEIGNCNMLILIVGGRYGSKASGKTTIEKERDQYESTVVSVTHKEFRTAKEQGIPIYVFVEKNVFVEFYTYLKNKNGKHLNDMQFAHVDSINVFRFIDEIMSLGIYVGQFELFSDIETILTDQWAGLFYQCLRELAGKNQDESQMTAIAELKSAMLKMEVLLKTMGAEQLKPEQMKSVIDKQANILIDAICTDIAKRLMFSGNSPSEEDWLLFSREVIKWVLSNKREEDNRILQDKAMEYSISVIEWDRNFNAAKKMIKEYANGHDISKLETHLAKALMDASF